MVVVLMSCAGDNLNDDPATSADLLPLTFNAATADKEDYTTRATEVGPDAASSLDKSFVVTGIKMASADIAEQYGLQTVFNETPVWYQDNTAGTSADNTKDWMYINETDGEHIRYWDQKAKGYVFFAYAPKSMKGVADAYKQNGTPYAETTGNSITLSNLKAGAANPTKAFVSLPTVVNPKSGTPAFEGAATMTFQSPLARIRIGFLSEADNEDFNNYENHEFYITDVKFEPINDDPSSACGIFNQSWIKATYDWNYENSAFKCGVTFSSDKIKGQDTDSPAITKFLDFNNYGAYDKQYYTITKDNYVEDALFVYATETNTQVTLSSDAATRLDKQWYYVFQTHDEDLKDWKLTIKVKTDPADEGDEKTAVVPLKYMSWISNHQYTYLFKVSPTSLSIVGVDAKVVDWADGGSMETEQHNW